MRITGACRLALDRDSTSLGGGKMNLKKSSNKGFTLIELIFVIAVIVVLASLFVPLALDKLAQANRAKADVDLNTLANSLAAFYTDIKHFAACDSADCNPVSGSNNDLKLLVIKGDNSAVATTDVPAMATPGSCSGGAGSDWNAAGNLSATPARNNAFNHLVVNNPNGDASEGDTAATTGDYNGWRGPYLARAGSDPWGNRYVVHIGAMETGGTKINSTGRGWILSAGEDGIFQTCPETGSLAGDDRGFIFVTQ